MGGRGGFGGGMPDRGGNRDSFGGRGSSDGTPPTNPNGDANASTDMNIQGTSASTSEGAAERRNAYHAGEL